ncbi:MAG: thioredoxin [Alphaproteobacteria bacterium]
METIIGAPAAPKGGGDLVKNTTTQGFQADVVEASRQQPVIVDFWAPWCGPCKQLGPLLERVVRAAGGKVRMVKVNIDENQPIAQALHIQSIPAVYAFVDGQPVDGFVGALPESQVKAFVKRLMGDGGPSPIDQALTQAREAQAAGDHGTASALFQQILRHEPGNAEALGGLARAMIGRNQAQAARDLLAKATAEQAKHPAVAGAQASLALMEQTAKAGDAAALEARVQANPDDHQARFDLALALFGAGRREAAIDALIAIIRRNREWNDQAARSQLLKFFEALGPGDPLIADGRRKVSAAWFA